MLENLLSICFYIEFFIGLLCYHKFDKGLKIFFLSSAIGALHDFTISMMKNPIQINIEQLVFMMSIGTIYFSYFLHLMKQTNRKKILIIFFGVLILLISVEIKFFGINTYRIWFTDIILFFFLLIYSVISLVKIQFENINPVKKIVNNLIGIPLVLYFIFLIHYDIYVGLLWNSPAGQFLYIMDDLFIRPIDFLLLICTIIAYLCQPKQESYLQLQ